MKILSSVLRSDLVANICVIGTGYVGLVAGTCFSDLGNSVTCVDIIPEKIERMKQSILPIYEPDLEELVERNVAARLLHFTTSYSEVQDNCNFIFIAVNIPTGTSRVGMTRAMCRAQRAGTRPLRDHHQ